MEIKTGKTPPPLQLSNCSKSQSQENNAKSSKETKRYEPNNILIKNYLTQTGETAIF